MRHETNHVPTPHEVRAQLDAALVDVFDCASLLAALATGTGQIEPGSLHPIAEALRRAHSAATGAWEELGACGAPKAV